MIFTPIEEVSVKQPSIETPFSFRAVSTYMTEQEDEGYYTEERWQNWMDRIRESEFDPEDEESALLFFNLQDDITIACAKAVEACEDGELEPEECLENLAEIREIALSEVEIGDEDKAMMIEGVQTSLIGVMASCEEYITNGTVGDADIEELILEAIEAEERDDMDEALGLISQAGARILAGQQFDIEEVDDELEYGFVSEWVNGLDSLESAVREPETIEEES